jgi:hypothetical protein
MGFPQDLQNFVSAFASAPQLTQIKMAAAAGGDGAAPPTGAAQLGQNFALGRMAAPQEGQTLSGMTAGSLVAKGVPQLRQKRPEPASAAHFGHFIGSSYKTIVISRQRDLWRQEIATACPFTSLRTLIAISTSTTTSSDKA